MLKNNKLRCTTRYIQNGRYSSKFKGCSPLQLMFNLIGNRPQTATGHTAKRYQQVVEKSQRQNEKEFLLHEIFDTRKNNPYL